MLLNVTFVKKFTKNKLIFGKRSRSSDGRTGLITSPIPVNIAAQVFGLFAPPTHIPSLAVVPREPHLEARHTDLLISPRRLIISSSVQNSNRDVRKF